MRRTFLAVAGFSLLVLLPAACSDKDKEVGANPPDGAGNGGAAGSGGSAGQPAAGSAGSQAQPAGASGSAGSSQAGHTGCGSTTPPVDCNKPEDVGKTCSDGGTCATTKCVGPDGKPGYMCIDNTSPGGSGGGAGSTGCGSDVPPPNDCDEFAEVDKPCGNGGTCMTTNCVGPDGKPKFYCSGSSGSGGSAGGTGCGTKEPPPNDCDEEAEVGKPCGNGGVCDATDCIGPDGKPSYACLGSSGAGGSAGGTGCGSDVPPPPDCDEFAEVDKPCGNGGTCMTTNCVGPDGKPKFYCSGSSGSGGSAGGTGCGTKEPPPSDCDEEADVGKACGVKGTCMTPNCVGPDGKPVYVCVEP